MKYITTLNTHPAMQNKQYANQEASPTAPRVKGRWMEGNIKMQEKLDTPMQTMYILILSIIYITIHFSIR